MEEKVLIEKVENLKDAKTCDELLTILVQSERIYNENINDKYVVNNWFEKIYNKNNNIIYVAKDNNKIVGYIYCKITSIENGPTIQLEALIDGIYVLEDYRNQGIATALINKIKEWAKQKNIKYLLLNVLEENENAIRLYYKEGFLDFLKELRIKI